MFDLSKRAVIVTGAAAGIGKAISIKCIEHGAEVIACDIDLDSLQILKSGIGSDRLHIYNMDVSDHTQVECLFGKLLSEHGNINCLVNNAGIYLGRNIIEYTPEMIDRVININIKGAVYFSKYFGEFMLKEKRNGVIVNMSSVAGQEGSSDAIYGLTKSALIGLTKSCSMNFSPYIRVNAIAPTLVDTDLIKNVPEWRMQEYRVKELVKKPLNPEDVANTAIFLLSELSGNYSGAVFDINNGCYLR